MAGAKRSERPNYVTTAVSAQLAAILAQETNLTDDEALPPIKQKS